MVPCRYKYVAVAVVLALGASTTTGAEAGDTGDPSGGTFRFAFTNALETLDPHFDPTTYGNAWWGPAYDQLVSVSNDGTYEPELATSWSISDDGLTWTFELRDDVTFHDGTPFNAEAVVANIDRGLTSEQSSIAAVLSRVDSAEALGEFAVQLNLNEPYASLIDVLTAKAGTMVSPAAFDADLAAQPVGTGPYVLTSYDVGIDAAFERNTDYWGEFGNVDRIEIVTMDTVAGFNALRAGEVDMTEITIDQLEEAQSDSSINVEEIFGTATEMIRFAFGPGVIFDDVRVRQALNLATDRELLVDFAGGTVTQQFASRDSAVYDPTLDETYPFDPEQACQRLVEAGHPEGVEFTISFTQRPYTSELAQILQAMWGEGCFTANLEALDAATTVERCSNQKQCTATVGTVRPSFDLAAFADDFFSPGASRLLNPDGNIEPLTAAIEAAQATTTAEDYQAAVVELNRVIVEQSPMVAFRKVTTYIASSPDVASWQPVLPNTHPAHETVQMAGS